MKIRTILLSSLLIFGFLANAQRSPQDSWYLDRQIPLTGMPGLNSPFGIDFSDNGDLYVVDHGNDRISKWNSDGDFIKPGVATVPLTDNSTTQEIWQLEVVESMWSNNRITAYMYSTWTATS